MKVLKKITILCAVVALGLNLISVKEVQADPPVSMKYPEQQTCGNSQGEITGFGSTCTPGGNHCWANPCAPVASGNKR